MSIDVVYVVRPGARTEVRATPNPEHSHYVVTIQRKVGDGPWTAIGSDDSSLIEFTEPPLTTVRQPSLEMAAAACGALLDLIGGGQPQSTEMLLAPELVVRGSAGRVPPTSPQAEA